MAAQDYKASAPDTGAMLRDYFKRKRIYQSALGRAVGRDYNSILGYKKRTTIQTTILWELCHALKHNFFLDLAAKLPAEYTTDVPPDDTKDKRIKDLEEELSMTKAQRDVLKSLFEKK